MYFFFLIFMFNFIFNLLLLFILVLSFFFFFSTFHSEVCPNMTSSSCSKSSLNLKKEKGKKGIAKKFDERTSYSSYFMLRKNVFFQIAQILTKLKKRQRENRKKRKSKKKIWWKNLYFKFHTFMRRKNVFLKSHKISYLH